MDGARNEHSTTADTRLNLSEKRFFEATRWSAGFVW